MITEDKTYLEHALAHEVMGPRVAKLIETKKLLTESFAQVVTGSFTRRDGTKIDYRYDTLPIADSKYVIVIDSLNVREDEDRTYGGNIELRIRDASKLQESGGYVTVYGPEITYSWDDRVDEDVRYGVKPAYVSWSSGGNNDAEGAVASSIMLALAARIAQTWTADLTPELQDAADEMNRQWKEDRVRRQAEHEAERAEIARKMFIIPDEGNTLRIKMRDKKVPITGKLVGKKENGILKIELAYKGEGSTPVDVDLNRIEKIETKLVSNNRYDEVVL